MPIADIHKWYCVSELRTSALTLPASVPAHGPIGSKSNGPISEANIRKVVYILSTHIAMIHRKTYDKRKYGGKHVTTTTESLHIQETDRMTNKRNRMLNWSVTNKQMET